jgi:hypothetical protein
MSDLKCERCTELSLFVMKAVQNDSAAITALLQAVLRGCSGDLPSLEEEAARSRDAIENAIGAYQSHRLVHGPASNNRMVA